MSEELNKPPVMALILVADDEENVVEGMKALLESEGYAVLTALNGLEAKQKLLKNEVAVALTDLKMPKLDGLELFSQMKKEGSGTQFIFITGKGTISTAVKAMKAGAYDYLTKPVEPERLKSIIPKAIEHHELLRSHRLLQREIKNLTRFEELIGQSSQMKEIYRTVEAVADSYANVIISGQSGTGKELVARAIHRKSGRSKGPLIAINCAALPKDILENELFGHEKGAFTGALQEKPGCFELANHGTLFLDEIGDMPTEIQAKFLRVLEDKKFRRLGGKREIEVDVRIIAATNRDPRESLRDDLYFRLSVVEIELPSLRDRVGDLPLLLTEFLRTFNQKSNKNIQGFSPECISIINRYGWPGNVRELKNVVERAGLLCSGELIESKDLPKRILDSELDERGVTIPMETRLEDVERIMIKQNLEAVIYNKARAATILGISLKTLYNKLERYQLLNDS